MKENIPNDSFLLPEGIVGDDFNLLLLNKAYSEIFTGELSEEEKEGDVNELKK